MPRHSSSERLQISSSMPASRHSSNSLSQGSTMGGVGGSIWVRKSMRSCTEQPESMVPMDRASTRFRGSFHMMASLASFTGVDA